MSPVTGLALLRGRILLSVHMGNFSPVDRDDIKEHKLESFAAVVALWTLVTLLIKLIHILLKCNTYKTRNMPFWAQCCESEVILSKSLSSRLPGLECSHLKIFIPVTEISVAKTEISVTRPSTFLRVARRDDWAKPSPVDRAQMKKPKVTYHFNNGCFSLVFNLKSHRLFLSKRSERLWR